MRRFEFVEGSSSKFWEIWVTGSEVSTRWGRIGTDGQSKAKDFASPAAATADMGKQIQGKVKKGYAEVASSGVAPAAAPRAAPAKPPTAPVKPAVPSVPTPVSAAPAPVAAAVPAVPAAVIPDDDSDPIADIAVTCESNQSTLGDFYGSGRVGAKPASSSHAWKRASSVRANGWRGSAFKGVAAVLELVKGKAPPTELSVEVASTLLAVSDYQHEAVVDWLFGVLQPSEVVHACLSAESLQSPYSQRKYITGTYPSTLALDHRTDWNTGLGLPWAWFRLGQHLAEMAPETRRAVEADALAAVDGAPLPLQAGVAVAFRNVELAARVHREAVNQDGMEGLLACLPDLSAGSETMKRIVRRANINSLRVLFANLVEVRGADAEPVLQAALAMGTDQGPELCFRAMSSIASPGVAQAMLAALADKPVAEIAQRYFTRHPDLAVWALSSAAVADGKSLAAAIFGSLVREDPDRARRRTRGAGRALAEFLLASQVEAASIDDLPALLRDPPWRRAQGPTGIDDVIAVAVPVVPDAMSGTEVLRVDVPPPGVGPNPRQWGGKFVVTDAARFRPTRWPVLGGGACLWVDPHVVLNLDPLDTPDGRPGLKPWNGADFYTGYAAYDAVETIWFAADALKRQKTARAWAPAAMARSPRHTLAALLPIALGKCAKAQREAAQVAIRAAVGEGFDAALAEYPAAVQEPVRRMLDVDPLLDIPGKPKPRPAWLDLGALPPIGLRDSSLALPLEAVDALVDMLSFSLLDAPYAGLAVAKDLCEPRSLGAFAWALCEAWLGSGGSGKDDWCLLAVGFLGGDEQALQLAPKIRVWPGESAHQRAVKGLDVLGAIGTDTALMQLHQISEKVKFKALKERAGERIAQIAEDRGMTAEELGDRLVPELDLDPDGSRILDFGPRQFRVGFDEQLKPNVAEVGGKPRSDLPKPNSKDDPTLSEDAVATWKLLKKNVRLIASGQVDRLERAMCAQRRWAPADFRRFLVDHPLVVHLSRRLVWGIWEGGALTATFRVSEDRSFADVEDEPIELPAGAQIGLPHALDLGNAGAWGEVFADYELLQPFDQLARPALHLEAKELSASILNRVKDKVVGWTRVKNLDKRGWQSGTPQDAGGIWEYHKALGGGFTANLSLSPGLFVGAPEYNEDQTLGEITLTKGNSWGPKAKEGWRAISAVQISELLLDLQHLTASA